MRRISLFLVLVFVSSQTEDNREPSRCTSSHPLELGKPAWLQFTLPNNPRDTKSFVHITKGEDFADFVLDGPYNLTTEDLDIFLPLDGYLFGGIYKTTVTLLIPNMGPQHEGEYKVEAKGLKSVCSLTLDREPGPTLLKEHFDWIRINVGLIGLDLVISAATLVLLVLCVLRTLPWNMVPSQDR